MKKELKGKLFFDKLIKHIKIVKLTKEEIENSRLKAYKSYYE